MTLVFTYLTVFDPHWLAFHALALGAALPAAWIDWKKFEIPDAITAIASAIAIGLCVGIEPGGILPRILTSGTVFFLLYAFSLLMKGKFGLGDVKFLSLTAFCIGPVGLWACLLMASLSGLAFGLVRHAFQARKREGESVDIRIPFMPFIALGIGAALFLKGAGGLRLP